jgi:membrane protease YdiL (CAAX protease family)
VTPRDDILEASRPRVSATTLALAASGIVVLAARPMLVGARAATFTFAATYAVLGLASSAVPVPSRRKLLSPVAVAAVGIGVMAVATFAVGPRIPISVGPQAIVLNTMAAVSEEAFFRRFLYGSLVRFGAPLAMTISAVAFAVVHVPAYGVSAFWVDLGAGLLLSWQRWASGGWAAPAVTHVAANLMAVM